MKYILLLFLVGCAYGWESEIRQPTAEERAYIWHTADTWEAEGLPYSLRCEEKLALLHIAVLSPDEVAAACGQTQVAGCLRTGLTGYQTVVACSDLGDEAHQNVIRHETLHALVYCTYTAPLTGARTYDRNHTQPGVWEASSGQDSVEWVAR